MSLAYRWSSRRFWTMVVFQTAFSVMAYVGKIDGGTFVALTGITLGAYFASATAQKLFAVEESRGD